MGQRQHQKEQNTERQVQLEGGQVADTLAAIVLVGQEAGPDY